METDGPICAFNGKKIIVADAIPEGLIAHWSFDDNQSLDSSGHSNHGKNQVPAGPAFGGYGTSGHFKGSNYIQVPNS